MACEKEMYLLFFKRKCPKGSEDVHWLESVVRSASLPIPKGDTVNLHGLSVTVLEVGDHGPTKVELTFDRSLDHSSMNFMAVLDGELRRVEPPPVGGTLTLRSPW